MKKSYLWLLIAAALALTGLLPGDGTDVADLEPARILLVSRENGLVETTCDTGAEGRGDSLAAAVRDMEQTAEGELFLDTASAVVFHPSARDVMREAAESEFLRPSARVYLVEGELPEAKTADVFLQTHRGEVTLARLRAAYLGAGSAEVPRLQHKNGRLRLIEP